MDREIGQSTRLRAYISGALTGEADSVREMYERIAALLAEYGFVPYVPHLVTDPVKHARVTPEHVYRTDRTQVATADLVVAFLGRPSFGVGQELEIAADALVPILIVVREGQPVSRMALGGPARRYGPLQYSEWSDLEPKLVQILPSIIAELNARPHFRIPDIAASLQRARVRAGMARAELARRVGASEDFITLVETADALTSNPSLAFLSATAETVQSSISELLGENAGNDVALLASLRDFAIHERLSFHEFSELQTIAARGLAPDRALSVEQWRQIREARARTVTGIQQLELPTNERS
jgi:transcriptional regulator with XRE-family HTH domain